jgi:hypothetical protein
MLVSILKMPPLEVLSRGFEQGAVCWHQTLGIRTTLEKPENATLYCLAFSLGAGLLGCWADSIYLKPGSFPVL